MGFNLTYRHLVTTPLMQVIQKFSQMSVFDQKTAYRLHKQRMVIEQAYRESREKFDAIGEKLAKKDDHGRIVYNEKGQHVPQAGGEKEYQEALEEFLSTPFHVRYHKVHIDQLNARFSPEEMGALEPILEGLDELEEE